MTAAPANRTTRRIEAESLDRLLSALADEGFATFGPREREGAIVYDRVRTASELPRGVSDEQAAGRYRLTRPGHGMYFEYAVGAHAWKRELLPPNRRLWRAERAADGTVTFDADAPDETPRAFVGVRACELAAIAVQDRVFTGGTYVDPDYAARRTACAIVAVQCAAPAGSCFCVSMGTGPRAEEGFDLALTEVERGTEHFFVVEVGSELGERLLAGIPSRDASTDDRAAAEARLTSAARRMGRTLDTRGVRELLQRSADSPHWNAVAERCLGCTNCTSACPTCFCTTVDDVPLLAEGKAERWRRWDSCFTMDFSYIHGGAVRASGAARYRQWLTHKLGTWWDQFGSSGCVGCGRCITWCPVGIDLTQEIAALRALEDPAAAVAGAGGAEEAG